GGTRGLIGSVMSAGSASALSTYRATLGGAKLPSCSIIQDLPELLKKNTALSAIATVTPAIWLRCVPKPSTSTGTKTMGMINTVPYRSKNAVPVCAKTIPIASGTNEKQRNRNPKGQSVAGGGSEAVLCDCPCEAGLCNTGHKQTTSTTNMKGTARNRRGSQ